MLITKSELATLIPHAGAMCLLDGVLEWNENRIRCLSGTHRDPGNPLRRLDALHAVCGIEYVSQAMAVHGALTNPGNSRSKRGYLASIRNFVLNVTRLDTVEGDLIIEANCLMNMDRRTLYEFSILTGGRIVMSGRATAVLDVGP